MMESVLLDPSFYLKKYAVQFVEFDSITTENNTHVKIYPNMTSTTMTQPLLNIIQLLTVDQ